MIDVIEVIKLGLGQLIWRNPQMFEGKIIEDGSLEHMLLHDLKTMVIDLQNLKQKTQMLEERTNILMLENAKLKLIIEDVCHEVSKEITHKPKTRKKS